MIRLLLADDHVLVREGLKQLFALTSDIHIAAEASNGAQVLDLLRQECFSIILLDLTMPGICGPDLIERIRARDNSPPSWFCRCTTSPKLPAAPWEREPPAT